MTLGPIVGIAGDQAIRVMAEPPPGVNPEIEVREESGPVARWTDEPGADGWTGPQVIASEHGIPGPGVHRFTLQNLDPAKAYRYRIRDIASGEPVAGFAGRFRPVPAELSDRPEGFALISCNKDHHEEKRLTEELFRQPWRDLAAQIDADPSSLRFLLHAGDQVYCDSVWDPVYGAFQKAVGKATQKPRDEWIQSQKSGWETGFRQRYRQAWGDEVVRRVLRSIPNLMMWDDHDIHDGFGSRATDFWTFAPTLAGVAADCFDDYQGSLNPEPNLGRGNRGFSCRLLGCRLVVLDTRSCRDVRKKSRTVLGESQENAFKALLAAHQPTDGPLLVVSSTPMFNPVLAGGMLSKVVRALAPMTELGDDLRDAWASKPNRRELGRLLEVLDSVRRRGVPVVVLSGDIHVHHLIRWWKGAEGSPEIFQVTSSPITNLPIGPKGAKIAYGKELAEKPFGVPPDHDPLPMESGFHARVDWFAARRGYARLLIDPTSTGAAKLNVRYRVEEDLGKGFTEDEERMLQI